MKYAVIAGVVFSVLLPTSYWTWQRYDALSRLEASGVELRTSSEGAIGRLFGNIEAVSLDNARISDAMLADLAALGALPAELDLSKKAVSDAGVKHLADCGGLQKLNLSGTAVTDAVGDALEDCESLRELDLSYTKIGDEGWSELSGYEALEYLNLAGTAVTDAGLADADEWQGLQTLDLTGVSLTGSFLQAANKDCRLQSLNLNNTGVELTRLAALSACANLRQLSVAGAAISPAGLDILASLPLVELDLSGSRLSGSGLRRLLAKSSVRWLRLADTQVGQGLGSQPLPAAALEELDLSRSGLANGQARALTGLGNLRRLNLDGNRGLTLASLPPLFELKKLESIRITNTGLPVAAAHQLYKALPRAIIYYGNAGSVTWLGYRPAQ